MVVPLATLPHRTSHIDDNEDVSSTFNRPTDVKEEDGDQKPVPLIVVSSALTPEPYIHLSIRDNERDLK